MLNPGTGKDDVKFFAMAVVMAGWMDEADDRAFYGERALGRLIQAVTEETRLRGRCRDTHLDATLRLRAW